MRTVDLSLPIGPQGQIFRLRFGIDIPPEEIATLVKYKEHMSRVRKTTILSKGMCGLDGLSLSEERGFEIRTANWSDAELDQFLHVMRLVTLEKEPASYPKVSKILYNRFPFENVQGFIAECNQAYAHGEASIYMQVRIDEQPLFDQSILKLWLNGIEYHADPKKEMLWKQLEASISAPSARALVLAQLHSKTLALLNLDYIAAQVISGEEYA